MPAGTPLESQVCLSPPPPPPSHFAGGEGCLVGFRLARVVAIHLHAGARADWFPSWQEGREAEKQGSEMYAHVLGSVKLPGTHTWI